jgi:hypothetical protein
LSAIDFLITGIWRSAQQLLQPDSAIVTKLAYRFARQVSRQYTPRRLSKC